MSKHPTSKLSPRDRACIEYGRKRESLKIIKFHTTPFFDKHLAWRHEALHDARAARERIFRNCVNCACCKDFKGSAHGEDHYACRRGGWVPESSAITCPHYKERRES